MQMTVMVGVTAGDRLATDPIGEFGPWYRQVRPRVFGAVYARCHDRDVANDVTDEAFARALTRWRDVTA